MLAGFPITEGWLKPPERRDLRGKANAPPKRHYPPLYEKLIPIALGILVVTILLLLVVIVSVLAGLFPFTR
jgi:uncharacterized RDD family membrane protein YckC